MSKLTPEEAKAIPWIMAKNMVLIAGVVVGICITNSWWFLLLLLFYTIVESKDKDE